MSRRPKTRPELFLGLSLSIFHLTKIKSSGALYQIKSDNQDMVESWTGLVSRLEAWG